MGLLRDLYRGDNQLDFPKWWPRFLVASAALVLVGLIALVGRGLNLGIDFEGGTVYEVDAPDVSVSEARDVMSDLGFADARIQTEGDKLRIQTEIEDPAASSALQAEIEDRIGPVASLEQVGPTWGEEITRKAIRALVWFFLALALYITVRLEWRMAVGALVAVLHDILISVGVYALFRFEVTPVTVIAFLTIMGYSLYDTIVVYDKVQEIEARVGASGKYTYTEMMNLSLNRVIMRSVNTTFSSLLPVLAMLAIGSLLFGATTLQEFGIALFIGLGVGAYSSISVAAMIVVWLKERQPRYRDIRARVAARGEAEADRTRVIGREDSALGTAVRHRRSSAAAASTPAAPSTTAVASPSSRPAPTGAIPPRPRKKKKR